MSRVVSSQSPFATWGLMAGAALLTAACSSVPYQTQAEPVVVPSSRPPARPPVAQAPVTPQPATAPSTYPSIPRRGGYYKDDGPGDNPPADMDSIPDAVPRFEPLHRFANNPYSVLGQNYTPVTELMPFTERGTASWYGRMFHGKRTSSGEPYDMYAMTGAHPTLPIPSYARVTNLNNGKSVVVRVNDRGPFHPGRVMDLSYTAAYKLGYADVGSAPVEVTLILPEEVGFVQPDKPIPPLKWATARKNQMASAAKPTLAPAPAREVTAAQAAPAPVASSSAPASDTRSAESGRGVFLQLGAFGSQANAEHFRAFVESELDWVKERVAVLPLDGKFRLHLGPFSSQGEARSVADRIASQIKLRPFLVMR